MTDAYTFSELSRILPLSRSALQSLAKKGELPAERRGRRSYISRAAVEAFLQRCITSLRPAAAAEPHDELVVELDDVSDLRHQPRFTLREPLAARMVTTAADVLDISATGMRIHHERPLRIGSEGRLSFEIPGLQRIWVVRARIQWSRLSSGGYLSGVSITDHHDAMAEALACLERLNALEEERESMQHKRDAVHRKQAQRAAMRSAPHVDFAQAEEQAALIRATIEQLRRDPLAAQRWYSRARYALAQESIRRLLPSRGRERDEALAVWEALERRVDLRAVCRIVAM